jgi:radical SAM superfamily enzyme YgiQ (UPF0313 family)
MKILLIEPHLGAKQNLLYRLVYYRSLALEQIAGITPDIHSVEMVEEKFRNINFKKEYNLVGISYLTCNTLRGYEIADEFRRREIGVVLGGYHPTALPQEAKIHADSVVIGDAETDLAKSIEAFDANDTQGAIDMLHDLKTDFISLRDAYHDLLIASKMLGDEKKKVEHINKALDDTINGMNTSIEK